MNISLPKEGSKKIYYTDKNETCKYDCFAYYFHGDYQKTTYSFHCKSQGVKEIEFKVAIEPKKSGKNNGNQNEKIFLIGGKVVENGVNSQKSSKAYSLFEE
ncbi:hypothetical protein IJR75_02315 [bacterium]|nr:hypothetical protein [bacterium]